VLDQDTLRRYLLGEMSESEAEAFEEEHFDDPEVLAHVRRAEDDLLDDFVAGRLSRRDRRSFERHHLATPGQRERLVAASALRLMTLDARAPRERATPAPGSRRKVWLVLAAVLLALLLGWCWVWAVAS
jgi:hypothetical protein